ncbi:lymphotactin [Nannospalax galili]|nr:lymphotactin [Nannospalax galili]
MSLRTQPLPVNRIKTYIIQEGFMKAVIFFTKRGLKICADPEASWVRAAVKTVDNRSSARRSMTEPNPMGTQRSTSTAATLSGQ